MSTYDVAVIGAGIAGAGVAWALAENHRVVIVEGEERPGYHTTGRSAAVYLKGYGNDVIRDLTGASEAFFVEPPNGFASARLVKRRGAISLVRPDQLDRMVSTLQRLHRHVPSARRLDARQVLTMVPALDPDYAAAGILDPEARDAALFDERPTSSDYLAMVVILTGIALSQRGRPGRAPAGDRRDVFDASAARERIG